MHAYNIYSPSKPTVVHAIHRSVISRAPRMARRQYDLASRSLFILSPFPHGKGLGVRFAENEHHDTPGVVFLCHSERSEESRIFLGATTPRHAFTNRSPDNLEGFSRKTQAPEITAPRAASPTSAPAQLQTKTHPHAPTTRLRPSTRPDSPPRVPHKAAPQTTGTKRSPRESQ